LAILGLAGVTDMDERDNTFTVRSVDPLTPPSDALIVAPPPDTPSARPVGPTVDTEGAAEFHVAWLVKSTVDPSENVPVAVNCSLVPAAMLGLAGLTAIDRSAAGATVIVVEPVMPEKSALTVEAPVESAVASPAVVMLATPVADELHVA
jgi:hypothetical protein